LILSCHWLKSQNSERLAVGSAGCKIVNKKHRKSTRARSDFAVLIRLLLINMHAVLYYYSRTLIMNALIVGFLLQVSPKIRLFFNVDFYVPGVGNNELE
jgi:hypothetical protein